MKLNDSTKEELKERLPEYAAAMLTQSRGKSQYNCPFCGSGTGKKATGAFTIYPDSNKFICFSCGRTGDIFDLIQQVEGINKRDVFKYAADKYRISIDRDTANKKNKTDNGNKTKPEKKETEEHDYTDFYKEANKHLAETDYHRGITLETLNRFNVGYVPDWQPPGMQNAPKTPRLIIPRSRTSYLARDTRATKDIPEYQRQYTKQNSPGKISLFNIEALRTSTKPLYIVEGEFDAMSIVDIGGEALATCSTSNISSFLKELKGVMSEYAGVMSLIIAFDEDEAGQKATDKLVKGLQELHKEYCIYRPYSGYKDANEALNADREEFKKAVLYGMENINKLIQAEAVPDPEQRNTPEPPEPETDQDLQEVLKAAESNVLDRKVVEYASSCNYIEELNFLYADLLLFAKAQNSLKEFKELWKEIRKTVARREGQIKAKERNLNKDYNYDKTGNCTIENVEFYLKQNNIQLKYNVILHKMEIKGFNGENQDQIVENAPAIIESVMQQSLEYCTQSRIASYMNVLAARNSYNPILEKLRSTQWDGKQRLNKLFEMLGIMDNSDENHYNQIFIKKWLMQCVCGLHNTVKKPFSLDIVLVFKGKQGIGKTRLLEALTMNSLYFGDGVVLDVRNKDDVQQSTSKWICELGEISSTFKKDMDSLKAFISKSIDEYRVPYGKTSVQYPRITSFCGTVNDDEFLIDRTGNRRFAVVPLQDDLYIDYDNIKNFNFLQLWAEIYSEVETMVKNGKTYAEIFRFNRSEVTELEKRNGVFIKPMPGQREVEDILTMADDPHGYYSIKWEYMTVSEFVDHWNSYLKKYTPQQIGRALNGLGIATERNTINGIDGRRKKLPIRTFTKRNDD